MSPIVMSDTLVFDIETKNFFTDPEVGWNNFTALKISVVGAYSYLKDAYFCFEEQEREKLAELFRDAKSLVGFSINRYDIPVLANYFQGSPETRDIDLWKKERIDLLEEVEMETGTRISLSKLAYANLGVTKDQHGSEAILLWKSGRIDELKNYCLNDVKLTRQLYDLYRRDGSLVIPDRATGELAKVTFQNKRV
ncbi:MAG: ribonuclease H-like domain-containing protein [Candidatus Liptonbacteria bacterium]|nr:ribonuclease H-like domain-containing protein [Candidatus Liptonbacteria bacterium]